MNDILRVTIKIADVKPITFTVKREEEALYRQAERDVNKMWNKWRQADKEKSSQEVLARVALGFAELYRRKRNELEVQTQMLDNFEKQLDDLLLQAE